MLTLLNDHEVQAVSGGVGPAAFNPRQFMTFNRTPENATMAREIMSYLSVIPIAPGLLKPVVDRVVSRLTRQSGQYNVNPSSQEISDALDNTLREMNII
jgi:hypothetical protein